MSDSYFVRIRGRVQGPFDEEKLQALAKRGQLSRVHEISPDGIEWSPAGNHSELFSKPASRAASAKMVEQEELVLESSTDGSAGLSSQETWYYSAKGQKHGPLDWGALLMHARNGSLSPQDLVWSPAMADWQPASSVPDLFPTLHSDEYFGSRRSSGGEAAAHEVPASVARSLEDSCMALSFVAVWLEVVGALFAVLCVALLAVPSSLRDATPGAATATALLFFLPAAAVLITAGVLLHRYRGRITDMLRYRDVERLDHALRALNSIWTFVGLILLVLTLALIGGTLFAFSVASS